MKYAVWKMTENIHTLMYFDYLLAYYQPVNDIFFAEYFLLSPYNGDSQHKYFDTGDQARQWCEMRANREDLIILTTKQANLL